MKPISKRLGSVLFCISLPLLAHAAEPGYTTLTILIRPPTAVPGVQRSQDPLIELKQIAPNLTPLVPPSKARTMESAQALERHRLNRYYVIDTSHMTREQAQALALELKQNPGVESADFEPPVDGMHGDNGAPIARIGISNIPDHTPRQNYLLGEKAVAPYGIGGVNAVEAWKVPGGKGQNMRVISSEIDHWAFDHVDLPQPYQQIHAQGDEAVVGSHDTASAGIIAAQENGFGTTGIVPYAHLGYLQWGSARLAALALSNTLQAGDVLQLGVHYYFSTFPEVGCRADCYMPLEDYKPVRDTIAYLTEERGVHVVLAAANGNINLDHPYFEGYYDRNKFDSGGIFAGAVNSKTGLRSSFSEYGSRVDLNSWGDSVTTTSWSKEQPTTAYTHTFGGTSSANPILAGVVASLQGVARNNGIGNLPPKDLRRILVATGYPQVNGNRSEIGVQPDLNLAIKKLLFDYASHPPTGRIGVPAEVQSGETFSTHVYAESPSNKPLTYHWNTAGFSPTSGSEATLSLTAPAVTADTPTSVSVDISDGSQTVPLSENLIIKAPPITATLIVPEVVEGGDSVPVRVEAQSATGKPLQYAWAYNTSSLTGNIGNSPNVTFTAVDVQKETNAPLYALVRDGTDSFQTPTAVIKIRPRQQVPYPVALITGATTVEAGKILMMNGRSSTGNDLRYAWTAPDFSPTASAEPAPSFVAPRTAGARSITLSVTDAGNRTDTASQIVTVTGGQPVNRPPTGTLEGSNTVDSGKAIVLTANASDPDGDPLTYAWTRPNSFTGTTGNTRSVTLTAPTVSSDTSGTASVMVSDGRGGVVQLDKPISVKAPPPVSNCGGIPPWSPTRTYATYAEQVSYNGKVYKQNFYSINRPPDVNSAEWGKEWHPGVACP